MSKELLCVVKTEFGLRRYRDSKSDVQIRCPNPMSKSDVQIQCPNPMSKLVFLFNRVMLYTLNSTCDFNGNDTIRFESVVSIQTRWVSDTIFGSRKTQP